MRIFFALGIGLSTLFARVETYDIPQEMCLKARYGHTLGGTMHSKKVLQKQLLQEMKNRLPQDDVTALKRIQKVYPSVRENRLIIKNCRAYYQSHSAKWVYWFDPFTFQLIKKKERQE